MKISKINTSSFSISRDVEHRIRNMSNAETRGDVKVNLTGKYAPMGKFKVTRRERVVGGAVNFLALKKSLYSEKSNIFYVNLNTAKLVYVSGKSRHGVELGEIEFFEKLLSLPSKTISTLGYLLEYGTTSKSEIDEDTLDELLMHGLAEEYLYERNVLLQYVIRELVEFVGKAPEGTRDLVRPAYFIPAFTNNKYNLSNFLEADDTIETTYERDSIKYGDDQIKGVLGTLFKGKADLIEITYLPYYQYRVISTGSGRQENYTLACLKGRPKLAYQNPFKLKPISLYSMGVGAKVIPIETDSITFSDIADLKQAKDEIQKRIINPLKSGIVGFDHKMTGGILFYGPPGCGKTYLAKATVGEAGISFISANIEDIMNEGVELAAKKLHDIFEYARSAAPCVLFFDEIDTIAARRDLQYSSSVVNQLLTEMDGITGLDKDVHVIGATNMPWRLDPALLRGGRFTEQIYIKPPDFESRVELFNIHLKKLADIATGVNARELASLTDYYSPADIKAIIDRTVSIALESALSNKNKASKPRIMQWHFIQAVRERKSSLISWFKYAEKQMEVEGAKESYTDLWNDIERFKNAQFALSKDDTEQTPTLRELMERWKSDDKKMI